MATFRRTFTSADLSGGLLAVPHTLNQRYVRVRLIDENNRQLLTGFKAQMLDTNIFTVDLSPIGTISGTWRVVAMG